MSVKRLLELHPQRAGPVTPRRNCWNAIAGSEAAYWRARPSA